MDFWHLRQQVHVHVVCWENTNWDTMDSFVVT